MREIELDNGLLNISARYNLDLNVSAIAAEFIKQNKEQLIKDIEYFMDKHDVARYACQCVADEVYNVVGISLPLEMLYYLDWRNS